VTVKHFVTFYVILFLQMEIFGKQLKALREERKMSQSELAEVLCTSKQNISRWEKGYFEPSQEATLMLARFFDVTIDYLFGVEE